MTDTTNDKTKFKKETVREQFERIKNFRGKKVPPELLNNIPITFIVRRDELEWLDTIAKNYKRARNEIISMCIEYVKQENILDDLDDSEIRKMLRTVRSLGKHHK